MSVCDGGVATSPYPTPFVQRLPVSKVVGVEMSPQAVEDARVNAKLTGQPVAVG